MQWYEAHMKERRLHAWHSSGDRRDVLAIDGNAKIYHRTCGALCAHGLVLPSTCALRSQPQLSGEIATHRMVDTLTESGYYELQVQLTAFEPREAACLYGLPRRVAGVFRKTWWRNC